MRTRMNILSHIIRSKGNYSMITMCMQMSRGTRFQQIELISVSCAGWARYLLSYCLCSARVDNKLNEISGRWRYHNLLYRAKCTACPLVQCTPGALYKLQQADRQINKMQSSSELHTLALASKPSREYECVSSMQPKCG